MGDLQTSTDQQKRLEYTARQKALYDYNTLMEENYECGYLKGVEKRNRELIEQMRADGVDEGLISRYFGTT